MEGPDRSFNLNVFCKQSAVSMRFCAGLPGAQFTLFARLDSAGGAAHGENLFGSEFFPHGEKSI